MSLIKDSFLSLHHYLERNDFAGYEYDDLLGSRLVSALTFDNLYLKIAAVQIAKRSVLNLRPLLGVKKLKSTKAFGFIVKGYLDHYLATRDETFLPLVRQHLSWLLENQSIGCAGTSWGNDFDFASRAGYYPKGLPTVVWTSHIAEAFDLAYKVFEADQYKQVVIATAEFVKNSLERTEDETGLCFAYAPGIPHPCHNSNLLAAIALLRAWRYTGDQEAFTLAQKSIAWSCARMNSDGGWFYGDKKSLHWIDNYHTAYNLDCLTKAREIAGAEMVSNRIIDSTYRFWRRHLFLNDRIPKFYHNRVYPIDIQAAAQAIESLSKYSVREPAAITLAQKVAEWTIENMQKPNGSFRYRKGKFWTNNLEPIHWGQATMLSALGCLLYHEAHVKKVRKEPHLASH